MDISIIGPDDPALEVLKAGLEADPELSTELIIIPWPEYRGRLMASLTAPQALHQAVFVPGHVWLPELAEASYLADLEEIAFETAPVSMGGSTRSLLDGIIPSVAVECRFLGKIYLLPFFTDGHILFYRADCVGDLIWSQQVSPPPDSLVESKSSRPPVPVVSPLELEAIAAQVHNPPEIYGVALKAHPSEIFLDWLPFLWAAGGEVLDKTGLPAFASETGTLALQAYLRLREYAPPNTHEFGNAEIAQVIRSGRAALVTTWGGQAGPLFAGRRTQYRAAIYPRPWNATWGIAIPANQPREKQAKALEVLREVCTARADQALIETAGSPVRQSSYSPEALSRYPWLPAQLAMLERCGTLPLFPQMGKFLGPLSEAVFAAFTGQVPLERALKQAEEKVLQGINA